MKRLLISVRNLQEAALALNGGCDLLDIKEPSRGPLGRADNGIISDIVRYRDIYFPQIPVSAALGEISDHIDKSMLIEYSEMFSLPEFYKLGTSNISNILSISDPFRLIQRSQPVGVFYVDHQLCEGLKLDELIKIPEISFANENWTKPVEFNETRTRGIILFDTWNKKGPSITELMTHHDLASSIEKCRSQHFEVAIAGRIKLEEIKQLITLDFQYLGLRSAICQHGERLGEISIEKIKLAKRLLNPNHFLKQKCKA